MFYKNEIKFKKNKNDTNLLYYGNYGYDSSKRTSIMKKGFNKTYSVIKISSISYRDGYQQNLKN